MSENFLTFIRKGISAITTYNYEGRIVQLRALSSSEIDDARYKSMELCNDRLARMILRLRLGQMKKTMNIDEIPADMYKNYLKYSLEFDYWVVFYSMKDFMPSDFTIEDVRKMRYIHEMSISVINISAGDDESVIEIIKTEDGQELAKIIYEFHQPLVAKIDDMTPLQHKFLYWSGPNAPKHVADSLEELEKILPAIGDRLRHVRG